MTTVAVLGTGLLGSAFVLHLLDLGVAVRIWNRSAHKLAPLVAAGAVAAATPADAVRGLDRVHLVLAEDHVVDAVLEAAAPGLSPDAWVIDHSTNAPALVAPRHGRLRAQGVRYVHAPVFMSPANARAGSGLMLLAADDADAAVLTPILQTMTGRVWHVGSRPEAAAVHKLMGNGMLVSLAGTMGDLFSVAQAQGMQPDDVLELFEVFRAGGSLGYIGKRVANADKMDASFTLEMARKDVRLMIDAAGDAGDADKLAVLPGLAAAMDRSLDAGNAGRDFALFAWGTRPRTT